MESFVQMKYLKALYVEQMKVEIIIVGFNQK
jgi:hypothetical protein